jgi:hypothetical protein
MLSVPWADLFVFVGMGVGMEDREEALAVPISLTLPGYRESLRRSSFARAVRWGVAFSLFLFSQTWLHLHVFSNWPAGLPKPPVAGPSVLEISLEMAGGFLAGMAICLLWNSGVLIRFRPRWLVLPFLGLGIAMGIAGSFSGAKHPFAVWPILIPLSVFLCVYFWVRLGDLGWVKSGQRALILRGIEGPREIAAQMRSQPWVEELSQGRTRKGGAEAGRRYVWSWLYRGFGPILRAWRWIAVPLLVVVLVQGYVSRLLVELAFLAFGAFIAFIVLPETSTLLLPEGRRERYRLTIVTAAVATLLLMATATAAVGLSAVLAALLPPIPLGMHPWGYASIRMSSLWLACLPVPWVFLSGFFGQRVPIARGLITIVVGCLAIGELFARKYSFYHGPTLLPLLLICGWALFPLALWITYRRWDLVGQRPAMSD